MERTNAGPAAPIHQSHDPPLSQLLPRLGRETLDLAKTELLRLKLEAETRSKSAGIALAAVGAALLFTIFTLSTIIVGAILLVGSAIDSYGAAAMIVAGALLILTIVCAIAAKASLSKVTERRELPDGRPDLVTPASKTLAARVGHARSESAAGGAA
jgi:hypothetical protein